MQLLYFIQKIAIWHFKNATKLQYPLSFFARILNLVHLSIGSKIAPDWFFCRLSGVLPRIHYLLRIHVMHFARWARVFCSFYLRFLYSFSEGVLLRKPTVWLEIISIGISENLRQIFAFSEKRVQLILSLGIFAALTVLTHFF